METFLAGRVVLHRGDSREVLRRLPDASIDSAVMDPPYALVSVVQRFGNSPRSETTENIANPYGRTGRGFMGQKWDTGETAFAVEFWAEVLRVLKPGGHLVAFSGTRTYHRLAVAIEDAGFEIRDQLAWVYGSGFPKGIPLAKHIEAALGIDWFDETERSRGEMSHAGAFWDQFDIALKPGWEPIVLARKPLVGSVAANVLAHGTGGLNVDGCRVRCESGTRGCAPGPIEGCMGTVSTAHSGARVDGLGRWPANVLHDGSPEVVAAFPVSSGQQGDIRGTEPSAPLDGAVYGRGLGRLPVAARNDSGSAARFFYSAKADSYDRVASKHPTVKPVDLMQWLCRLVTPPGGVVLDAFAGSGTTGEAAWREGFRAILIEREEAYCADIRRRLHLAENPSQRAAVAKAKGKVAADHGPLFEAAGPA